MFSPPFPSNFLKYSTEKLRFGGVPGNAPLSETLPVFKLNENVNGNWLTASELPLKSITYAVGSPVVPGGWPCRIPRLPLAVKGVQSPVPRNASPGAPSRDTENAIFSPPSVLGSLPHLASVSNAFCVLACSCFSVSAMSYLRRPSISEESQLSGFSQCGLRPV